MKLAVGRIVFAVVVAEIVGVATLVALVAAFGPAGAAAQHYAEELGAWIGPISGLVLCFAGGWWAARGSAVPVANGLALGVSAAVLDLGLAMALSAKLGPILLVSNAGRIVAGTLGGWKAATSRGGDSSAAAPTPTPRT